MTTELDAKVVPKVASVLNRVGVSATLLTRDSPAFDVEHGDVIHGGETETSVTISPLLEYTEDTIDGDVVLRGDCYCFIAGQGLAVTPTEDTKVAVSGQTWQVVSIETLRSGDDIAAYRLQLRR